MPSKTRKATFNLHEEVLAALDQEVARGGAPSKNALVERALVRELREMRRQARKLAWEAASRDRLFLKDLDDVHAAFASADAETARTAN